MAKRFKAGQVVADEKDGQLFRLARVDADGTLYVANDFLRGSISKLTGVRPLNRKERGPR